MCHVLGYLAYSCQDLSFAGFIPAISICVNASIAI